MSYLPIENLLDPIVCVCVCVGGGVKPTPLETALCVCVCHWLLSDDRSTRAVQLYSSTVQYESDELRSKFSIRVTRNERNGNNESIVFGINITTREFNADKKKN